LGGTELLLLPEHLRLWPRVQTPPESTQHPEVRGWLRTLLRDLEKRM
jgi:hypothetical protein